MKFPIRYNKESMTLTIEAGKYYKCLQCPFATWWKARKYFKRPKFKFYFGPMWKYKGKVHSKFGDYDDYEYKGGYWPAASTEYLKWYTPKWFPIHVMSWDISWKDKYNTPRYERPGHFIIFFGRDYHKHWQFSIVVKSPDFFCCNDCTKKDNEENYWESILWYLHYPDKYNEINGNRDLYLARQNMKSNHWSSHKLKSVDDFIIDRTGEEILYMGYDELKNFMFVDIISEKLYDEISFNHPTNDLISYDDMHSLLLSLIDKLSKITSERSRYIKLIDDSENNRKCIRIYFRYNDKFIERLNNKDYTQIELNKSEYIDLGPSFKDDYLNNKGIKEIKNNDIKDD